MADGRGACVMLRQFLEERYKGTRPVLWGDALREAEFTYWIYEGLFGLGEWTAPHLVAEPPFPLAPVTRTEDHNQAPLTQGVQS